MGAIVRIIVAKRKLPTPTLINRISSIAPGEYTYHFKASKLPTCCAHV